MKTEKDLLWKRINERFVKAFVQFGLLHDDDHVLVGLSGGKDSLLLTELLARRARILHPRFKVEALHVRMENVSYETDTSYLHHFCEELGVQLHLRTTKMPSPLPLSQGREAVTSSKESINDKSIISEEPEVSLQESSPCFLCSWQRRKQLFNVAQELDCNKIALGHHQDDLLHTALMNLFYQGRFGTMPARLQMKKMPLQIIRPLCLIPESLIRQYAELSHYEKQVKLCPYEHESNRTNARRMFEEAEARNPEVRFSMWNALEREGKLVEE